MSDFEHHHVADGIRHIKVLRSGEGLILAGTETWAAPASVDLLMHDIFHHHPTDDGSMVCELMSYGAQMWIEHHRDELRLGIDFDELSAIIEQIAGDHEPNQSVAILKVEPAPAYEDPEQRFMQRFREVCLEAFQESSFDPSTQSIPDEQMGLLCDDENIDRYAAWMFHGLMRARNRYPDPEATFVLFNALSLEIKQWSTGDSPALDLVLDEKRARLVNSTPEIRVIREDASNNKIMPRSIVNAEAALSFLSSLDAASKTRLTA